MNLDIASPQRYTARQIARALGLSKRAVALQIGGLSASGIEIIQGQQTAAWELATLPAGLRGQLAAAAVKAGCGNVESFLALQDGPWQPAIPVSELARRCIDQAESLKRALAEPLARRNELKGEELDRLGLECYRRYFPDNPIEARHWRNLFNRTLERDGGREAFGRLEIYLSERLTTAKSEMPSEAKGATMIAELQNDLPSSATNPAREEVEYLWLRCCDYFEERVTAGEPGRKVKGRILEFLHSYAPYVSAGGSLEGLRKKFERYHERWIEREHAGEAFKDQRQFGSGHHRRPPLTEEDRHKLIARTLDYRMHFVPAWRELFSEGELSAKVTRYYLSNPASKSYAPRAVRNEIMPEARRLWDIHHGPKQARLKGAYITRDWSDTASGDWFQGDDVTINHYWWEDTEEGLWIGRGQLILMIDCRSNYVLSFALQTEKSYNARIIRSLITRTHDKYGLPREGFYFEKGIWRDAKLLTGAKGDAVPIKETELGLRQFVRFRHAEQARGKVIEPIIGVMQNLLDPLPGYAGRDEKNDKYERVQSDIKLVRSGKKQAWECLFSKAQMVEQLVKFIEIYNSTPQEGRLEGLAPREAYEKFLTDELHSLTGDFRYLLANHRRVEKVGKNGIRIQHGKNVWWYSNERVGRLIGQKVLTWWDPEDPSTISVTDLDKQNPFVVPLVPDVPATTATPEQMAAAKARIKAQNSHTLTTYRIIEPYFKRSIIRRTFGPPEVVETGQAFAAGREEVQAEQKAAAVAQRKLARVSRQMNFTPSETALQRGGKEAVESLEQLSEFLSEPDSENAHE